MLGVLLSLLGDLGESHQLGWFFHSQVYPESNDELMVRHGDVSKANFQKSYFVSM